MGPETTDSLTSLLPRKNSDLWFRRCPCNVAVALCSCAFAVGLASAAALCVLVLKNRSLESSYESAPPAVVFPAARLLLFEQPTRDVPKSTARERVRRVTQAAPNLVERNDQWRLVRVTRRRRRSRPVLDVTTGGLSRSINVAFPEAPLRTRGNALLEEKLKSAPAAVGWSVQSSATGGASGASERSSQLGSGDTEAKDINATAQVVHHSLNESALMVSEKSISLAAMPRPSPGARKAVGDKAVNWTELTTGNSSSASVGAA